MKSLRWSFSPNLLNRKAPDLRPMGHRRRLFRCPPGIRQKTETGDRLTTDSSGLHLAELEARALSDQGERLPPTGFTAGAEHGHMGVNLSTPAEMPFDGKCRGYVLFTTMSDERRA